MWISERCVRLQWSVALPVVPSLWPRLTHTFAHPRYDVRWEVVRVATIGEVLRRYDASLTESDLAEYLDAALRRIPGAASAPITQGDVVYLAEHAGQGAAEVVASWDPDGERRQREQAVAEGAMDVIASTLSIEAAARLLGIDRTRISHRLSRRALWAVNIGSRRRLPDWQFRAGRELPGLAIVIEAIPSSAHPADVAGLMTTPQDELDGRTPVDHLASGGDPAPVADLLADLARW
jgi:hypothetical protein